MDGVETYTESEWNMFSPNYNHSDPDLFLYLNDDQPESKQAENQSIIAAHQMVGTLILVFGGSFYSNLRKLGMR